jgi:chemotaxis protein CheX
MPEAVSLNVVIKIVESIFLTMMDVEVSVSESASVPAGDRITAAVYLEGDWNGAVSIECSHPQACSFAGSFLGMDAPEIVDDDVRDALGELANMIGGNIKSVIGTDIRLSMPSVIDGNDYTVRVCGGCIENKIAFQFAGGAFWVVIVGKEKLCIRELPHAELQEQVM